MKQNLLKSVSIIAFSAMVVTTLPVAALAASALSVGSITELEASPSYKNASAAEKASMRNFVTQALTDPNAANSFTGGGLDFQVIRPVDVAAKRAADEAAAKTAATYAAAGTELERLKRETPDPFDTGTAWIKPYLDANPFDMEKAKKDAYASIVKKEEEIYQDSLKQWKTAKEQNPHSEEAWLKSPPAKRVFSEAELQASALRVAESQKKQYDDGVAAFYVQERNRHNGQAAGTAGGSGQGVVVAGPVVPQVVITIPAEGERRLNSNNGIYVVNSKGEIILKNTNPIPGGNVKDQVIGIVKEDGTILPPDDKTEMTYKLKIAILNLFPKVTDSTATATGTGTTSTGGTPLLTDVAGVSPNVRVDADGSVHLAAGNATPITITLPASGTKELANGYSVDASGVIKDANGKFVAKITDSGKLTDMAGKASNAMSTSQLADLFKSQPPTDSNYERCEAVIRRNNCGSYAQVAPGTTPVAAVAQVPINDQFVQKNSYVAATDTGEVVKQTVSNTQINDFIRGNLNDPAKIAAAMKKYNIDLARIQLATGYSRQETIDYINKSGNTELKAALGKWTMPTTRSSVSSSTAVTPLLTNVAGVSPNVRVDADGNVGLVTATSVSPSAAKSGK